MGGRKVFRMSHPRTPTEECAFGVLPRDLAHLVLLHVGSLPRLLLLKSVSRATANSVRRTIHSDEFMDLEEIGSWRSPHTDMLSALETCSLSLPMKVAHNFDWEGSEVCAPKQVLIVHEFELEFRLNDRVVPMEETFPWFVKMYDVFYDHDKPSWYERHLKDMVVECTQFCVEWPGVGVFHGVDSLWDALNINVRDGKNDDDGWRVSSQFEHRPMELAMHLTPFARIGDITLGFNGTRLFHSDFSMRQCEQSLLQQYLKGRVVQ